MSKKPENTNEDEMKAWARVCYVNDTMTIGDITFVYGDGFPSEEFISFGDRYWIRVPALDHLLEGIDFSRLLKEKK